MATFTEMDRGAAVRTGPPHADSRHGTNGIWARVGNAALGAWLFASAFVFDTSGGLETNLLICGALAFAIALGGLVVPTARWLNMLLSVWLFLSSFELARANGAALWNSLIVALVVFCLSIVPNESITRLDEGRRYAGI